MFWYKPSPKTQLSKGFTRIALSASGALILSACQQVGVQPASEKLSIETNIESSIETNKLPTNKTIEKVSTTEASVAVEITNSSPADIVASWQEPVPQSTSLSVDESPKLTAIDTPVQPVVEPHKQAKVTTVLEAAQAAPANEPAVELTNEALIEPAVISTEPVQQASVVAVTEELQIAEPVVSQPEPEIPAPVPVLDLWQLTVANYALTQHTNTRVEPHDAWYRKHTEYMQRVTNRSSRYYHYVLHEVLAADMPAEIALLPIVESGFDTFAYSHGRAAGAWQFIPSTGRLFGLQQTWWYDGRRDVVASTAAAIKYLKQLHGMFDGDWLLAIAAYNGGPGTVSKAIRANKKQGKPTDFWSLSLPTETMHYVPKLLGLSKVVADHAGTDKLTTVANEPYFAIVETGSQIDLAQAAELADISVDEIYRLNSGFNQWATDPEGPHRLLIPIANADQFKQGLANLDPQQRVAWQRYIIQPGDSLLKLSKRYHVSVDLIRSLNNLQGNTIIAGKPLMIPVASKNAEAYTLSAAQRVLKRQQQLSATHASNRIEHKVVSGESLWTIAKKYKVTVKQIANWNKIGTKSLLQIDQKLNIWPRVPSSKLNSGSRQVVKKLTYKVRNGDNLSMIAWRFNISVKDIQRWNSDLKKYLQPGQQLTLYVDVTKTRG